MPILSTKDVVVSEADGTATVTLELDAPASAGDSVRYYTSNGSAGVYDFTRVSTTTLNFNAGDTEATLTFALTNDTLAEGTEHFFVVFNSPVGITLDSYRTMVSIKDNDIGDRAPIASVADYWVDEGAGTAEVVITLDRSAGAPVTIDYSTSNGTAGGGDYTGVNSSVTFAPFETAKTISIPITDDSAAEGEEAFTFNLDSISGAGASIGDGLAEIRIGKSDGIPVAVPVVEVSNWTFSEAQAEAYADIVFRLSAPSSVETSVNWYTSNDTAGVYDFGRVTTNTLVFAPGETLKTMRLPITQDTANEGPEHFYIVMNSANGLQLHNNRAVVTLTDDDRGDRAPIASVADLHVDEKDGTANIAIMLDRSSSLPVTVNYTTNDVSANGGSDYTSVTGSVTFNPFETSKVISVEINDDSLSEAVESFQFELTSISGVSGADIGDGVADVFIGESDTPTLAVPTVTVAEMKFSEGPTEQYVDLVFSLSGPSASQTSVNWYTSNSSAGVYDFARVTTSTLTFAPGETTKTVRLPIRDDTIVENTEQFYVVMNGANGLNIDKIAYVFSIVDNDSGERAPVANVSDTWVDESEGLAYFSITLDRVAALPVEVDYMTVAGSANTADYDARAQSVVFNPGETAKTVAIRITDDAAGEGDQSFALKLTDISGISGAGIGESEGTATISRNDGSPVAIPQLTATVLPGMETGDQMITIVFQLSAPAASAAQFSYYTTNGSAGVYDFDRVTTSVVRFDPGETIKVVQRPVKFDTTVEGTEDFNIIMQSPSGLSIAASPVTGQILDDDPSAVSIATADSFWTEGDGLGSRFLNIYIDREGDASAAQSVDWAVVTTGGPTVDGNDFRDGYLPFGTVTFATGQTRKLVSLPIAKDSTVEPDETFSVELSNPTGGMVLDNERTLVTIVNDDGNSGTIYDGTGAANAFTGTEYADTLNGNGGADTLNGVGGDDIINGGTGADSLDGGDGNDSIIGLGGNDTIEGGGGNDTLKGTANNDRLLGQDGNDRLFGELGRDTLEGGNGDDSLVGGNSYDSLLGGANNDTLLGQGEADTMRGGSGNDSMDGGASADQMFGDSGNDTLKGGAYNDNLDGGGGSDFLDGGSGLDALSGGGGADTLLGGSGNDTLDGGSANDSLNGGIGKDSMTGGSGSDTLIGGAANDSLSGGTGADSVDGGSSADVLFVFSGEGGDTLTGGSGADTFDFETGFVSAVITDFTSQDVIDLADVSGVSGFADLSISYGTNASISLGGGDSLTLLGVSGGLASDDFLF